MIIHNVRLSRLELLVPEVPLQLSGAGAPL